MTRGLSKKVKLGAHSCSSCQKVYGNGSRLRITGASGLYSGTTLGTAGNFIYLVQRKKSYKQKYSYFTYVEH